MDFGIKLWGDNGNQERYYVHVYLGLEEICFHLQLLNFSSKTAKSM